ncbi:MAG: T9SS type A sorting domain-containing protein [Cyclobacteriaceae bacterium]
MTALQEGDATYSTATEMKTFSMAKASMKATADDLTITYGGSQATSAIDAGTYSITVAPGTDNNYDFTYVNGTLTIEKADQAITASPIEDKLLTDVPFDIVASNDSGLPLTYSITGPATISGSTITLDGTAGDVTVTVSQAGDNNYNAAADVTVSFTVDELLSTASILSKLKVYPNPASHFIEINTKKDVSAKFYTLDGTLALDYDKANGKVDISTLKEGVYMLELIIDNERTFQKFIKTN